MPPETILRVSLLQTCCALSDPIAKETLYYGGSMHRFAGTEPGGDHIVDDPKEPWPQVWLTPA